ncbi:MAG: sugar kinase [Treponema sp.]|jgi:NAD kinase|nr:sugar kinase [Treponema sp.]
MKKFENRIVIVTRETRLEKVLVAQNTVSQAKFYINRLGGDFDDYKEEHDQYGSSIKEARQGLEELGNVQLLDRKYLPNFIFAPGDIVMVIGQDGLVVNTLKYLNGQPVIGINPDPSRWDGVLLPFAPKDAAKIATDTVKGKRKIEEVTMARVKVQNGQELLAVNDFFIGQKTHTSARYVIKYSGVKEPQSSSGVIISTGLGSTGWMKSIIAGASRINTSVIGKPYGGKQESDDLAEDMDEEVTSSGVLSQDEIDQFLCSGDMSEQEEPEEPLRMMLAPGALYKVNPDFEGVKKKSIRKLKSAKRSRSLKLKTYGPSELSNVVGKWSSKELIFAVREPFPSKSTGTTIVFGTILPDKPLRIESLMGENGVIFSDGIENDYIAFNSGTEAVIGLADKRGRMVI